MILPRKNPLTIDWDAFQWASDTEQQLIMWSAEPGSPTHDKLRILSSWIQAPLHSGRADRKDRIMTWAPHNAAKKPAIYRCNLQFLSGLKMHGFEKKPRSASLVSGPRRFACLDFACTAVDLSTLRVPPGFTAWAGGWGP
ncbi:hypothetical protein NtRootA1_21470 [Arthrobacter sp. NtRootA1]|nr:hypothetical protein NtRootA1_21470 [Arthrobacter sp. NtRootA1]